LEWVRQFGTSEDDRSYGVSSDDAGNVYVTGATWGDLEGSGAGDDDAFLRKYDSSGNVQWTSQLGSASWDGSFGVSLDGLGNLYISGYTSFDGILGPTAGGYDGFVSKYTSSGNLEWTRQYGTGEQDESRGVSVDALGNVYVTGLTDGELVGSSAGGSDVFLRKYNTVGTHQWTRQLGSTFYDSGHSVSFDGLGGVYVGGLTWGALDGMSAGKNDAFVSRYSSNGVLEWTRQLGTSEFDYSLGLSADDQGNVYVSGRTDGDLGAINAGEHDAFVAKYDSNGTLQWTEQLGTVEKEYSYSVSADESGFVYISGFTDGDLDGSNAGESDAFISKYTADGSLLWTEQLGTAVIDESRGVSADGLGNVYISGFTAGDLDGTNAGGWDAFVAKFSDPAAVVGDYNDDGDVDGIDFLRWQRGESPSPLSAQDLASWEAAYGAPLSVAATAVPEPSTVLMLVSGAMSVVCLSRCSRRSPGQLTCGQNSECWICSPSSLWVSSVTACCHWLLLH
jgi:hypothetical protein